MADEYRNTIAKITDTFLGVQDHGIWTATLTVEYENGGVQGIGGYALDQPLRAPDGEFLGRFGTADGMEFVRRTCAAVGVETWEELKGKIVRVLFDPDDTGLSAQPRGIAAGPFSRGGRLFVFGDHMEADQKALEARAEKARA